ncbi:MAG: (d)CMP kinase [Lachnospiraceae bacterium]|nr:(d)CMP kinase [Lachnospiraceae bacterium]
MNIAIDGPAGAGKSTIAKRLAKELRFVYVDTGAMYRAIGLWLLKNGVSTFDEDETAKALPSIEVTIRYENGNQCVILNGEDVSGEIRTEDVSQAASRTSAYPAVRRHLLELQRKLARENDVIMDGRDIGTVVLPDAELKIYLSASREVRAERRYLEYREKGIGVTREDMLREIEERDTRDMNRDTAPLRFAYDAVYLDSTNFTVDEVLSVIKKLVKEKS